jgi:hypothetical protein
VQLADGLAAEPAFWAHVEHVQQGADPAVLASVYGEGDRRTRVLAVLLSRAADEPSESRERTYQAMVRAAYHVPNQVQGVRGPYVYRPDFLETIRDGAMFIARRGAQKCLACGAALPSSTREVSWAEGTRPVRRDYCDEHDEEAYGASHTRRIEAMRTVFDYAAEAVSAAGYPA